MKQQIKLFKSATMKSIMDITPNLNYHKENNQGEMVYKGTLQFAITEIGTGKYAKAYIPKSDAKELFYSIVNGTFSKDNKDTNGVFAQYGGTPVSDKGPRSRALKMSIIKNNKGNFQLQISIEEGPGKVTKTGAIIANGKSDIRVVTYLSIRDARKMAYECLDFIRIAEEMALKAGKPHYTFSNRAN